MRGGETRWLTACCGTAMRADSGNHSCSRGTPRLHPEEHPSMPTRLSVILLIALSALVAACSGGGSQLTGTTWQLTAVTEKVPAFQGVVPADQQAQYTILFNTDGSFNASADCNQLSGSYTTSGSSMTITPGPMTMAFCGEQSLDSIYVHMLGEVSTFA